MSDSLFDSLNSERGNSITRKRISYCAICETRLPPGAIFCPECDPPLPPVDEPEETGISFGQALFRISALVILFMLVVFGKLNITFDLLLAGNQVKGELKTLAENEQPQDKDFQTVHMITAPLVNVRSKPSMDGKVILVVEQGMNLNIIKGKEYWSKVHVLGKTGWISNKLFKSEILAPE